MLQTHYQVTTTTTSAHLAQTMTLLSLTNTDLLQKVETELANNPALELVEEHRCPMCKRILPPNRICPVCSQPKNSERDEAIVFISPREDFYTYSGEYFDNEPEEQIIYEGIDLPTFVLRQIATELDPKDRIIVAYILTNLDEDGFLTINSLEIARFHHRLPSEIEALIKRLQRCEPIGVCSKNPREALKIQAEILSETVKLPKLTLEIIEKGLDLISHHHYAELAKQLNTNPNQIELAAKFITDNLNPFPARAYWGDVRNPTEIDNHVYHNPDILIYHLNDNPENPLVVEIILPIRGTLRVNPLFKQAFKTIEAEKAEEWKGDLEKATLLIKCIQQRSNALRLLMEKLVVMQKQFILNGEKSLRSITRAEIAKELSMHESTISRAVSGKAIQLPNKRIVPMAMFFDRSLAYRSLVKEIVEKEEMPLSDSEIQEILAQKGINIARRTVAKYRSMEGILPAHLR